MKTCTQAGEFAVKCRSAIHNNVAMCSKSKLLSHLNETNRNRPNQCDFNVSDYVELHNKVTGDCNTFTLTNLRQGCCYYCIINYRLKTVKP